VITEERSWGGKESNWKVVNTVTSSRPFVIEDGSGSCLVSCAETDVERESPEVVEVGSNQRHKIWRLHSGDPLYALGYLIRLTDDELMPQDKERSAKTAAGLSGYDRKKKVTENMMALLKLWKQDQRNLVARFDADGNGTVDWHEWEKAQATARELAEKKFDTELNVVDSAPPASKAPSPADALLEKITHKLVRPTDGRPLLIAKGTEKSRTTRKQWQTIFGLALFIGGVFGLVVTLSRY
jgi:hypothetical protein